MNPIELRIQPGAWRIFLARKNDKAFLAFSEKVFRRDDYICQFCGFQAKDYQEVVNLDNNYQNNKFGNLTTACCFCTQCFFLESVGIHYGGGSLVYLPEISQGQLNAFCHVIFCAITNDTGYKDSAQSIYRSLKFRSQPVEERFGEGTSEPSVFAQLLIETYGDKLDVAKQLLTNIRLLPSRARFKMQIDSWAATALQELAEEG
ncbi:MAG: type IVB secretion system protein IcmJDotN [Gammaproteobacteria bacterium]